MRFPICERCGSSAWHCSVCVPAAPEREPLKGEPSEERVFESVPVSCMPVHYSLCLKLIEGKPGAIADLKALYRERLTMLEARHAAEVRRAAERGPVAQPPEEG